jgi:hypothetical protein
MSEDNLLLESFLLASAVDQGRVEDVMGIFLKAKNSNFIPKKLESDRFKLYVILT